MPTSNTIIAAYVGKTAVSKMYAGALPVTMPTTKFNPSQLFANGELGWWYDVADLDTQFTDFAGTVRVQNTGDTVAVIKDKSGSGSDAKRSLSTARPLLKFLPTSNRPYHDYDGVDDVLTNTTVDLGTNCTIIRILAGSTNIQTGQTIAAGNSNRTIDNFGEIVVNRALTAAETAAVTAWCDQRAGRADQLNVQYGADATNELIDIYPSSGHSKDPIFLMVHGGGWRNGDKLLANVIQNKFQMLIPKGWTCISGDYKLDVGTDPVTVQAASVAKMIAFIQARYPGRPLVVAGHSAGAHLVNLATSVSAIRNAAGVQPWTGTLLLDSAAYNVVNIMSVDHLPLYDEPWSLGESQWEDGSPALKLDSRQPPTMCVVSQTGGPHGESDAENTQEWIDLATLLGCPVTLRNTPLDHGDLNNFLGLPPSNSSLALDPTYSTDVYSWLVGLVGAN